MHDENLKLDIYGVTSDVIRTDKSSSASDIIRIDNPVTVPPPCCDKAKY